MIEPDKVRAVVASIKARRQNWKMSHRAKNNILVDRLAIPQTEILDIIYKKITWRDYSSGPEDDNHTPRIVGDIWIFGLIIEDVNCYLKFQDKPSGIVMWISVHPAEHPLQLPYQ